MTDDRAEQEVRRSPVEPVKALTVRQPWATLLCDPALPKWIETRPRRTNVRGRIAIHAAARRPASFWLDTWRDERPPEPFRSLEDAGFDLDRFFDPFESSDGDGYWRYDYRWSRFRFGYLIGTVDLYDCVPILDAEDPDDPCGEMASAFIASQSSVTPPDQSWFYDDGSDDIGVGVSDQIPYGDFTPGRWAWLTRDAVLLDEPIPMRGSLGWQTVDLPLPKKTESP